MAAAAGNTHPSPAWSIYTYTTHTALLVLLLAHTQVLGESTSTATAATTTPGSPQEDFNGTVTSQINSISTEEGDITTSPWPPDRHEGQAVSTHQPVTTDEQGPRVNKADKDVTTTDPSGYTAGYDVMKSVTFQVTLGVCMSLVGLLLVILMLMMVYTKYRGWKDRMHIAPTVRTGSQVGTDRQELMT